MKKYNLFKVLAITIIVCFILTLFVPASYVDYSGKIVTDKVTSVGIVGILSNIGISIQYFNGIAVLLVATACLYGVLSRVEVYNKFVTKTASMFKNKEGRLVCITSCIFAVLACVVSDPLILIVFIPYFYQVQKELNVDKKVILSSTVIASLIGGMCGIYNSALFNLLKIEVNTLLLVKVIILILSLVVLNFFIAPRNVKKVTNKKTTKKEEAKKELKKTVSKVKKVTSKEKKVNKVVYAVLTLLFGTIGINKFYAGKIKAGFLNILFCWTLVPTILSVAEFITVLTEKVDKNGDIPVTSQRRSNVLFATGLVLFVLVAVAAIIPWESLFTKFTYFSDFNKSLNDIKIGKYQIFNSIIGAPAVQDAQTGSTTGVISALGSWSMTDMATFVVIMAVVVALVNNIKLNDFVAASTKGIKKILPVAITAMLISIVLVITVTTGINITLVSSIVKGFNIFTITLGTIIGSVFTADFYYFVSTLGQVFTTKISNTDLYGVVALLLQSLYYLTMFIAPTSVGLVIGLYFLDIPYGKWFKYIWKVLLITFLIILLSAIVVYLFVIEKTVAAIIIALLSLVALVVTLVVIRKLSKK